jgi:hypothetical protein
MRKARKLLWLPKTFGRILLAPWLPVKFADFWVVGVASFLLTSALLFLLEV